MEEQDMFTPSPPAAGSTEVRDDQNGEMDASAPPASSPKPSTATAPAPIKTKYLWPIPSIPGNPLPASSPAVQFLSQHVAELTASSSSNSNPNSHGPGPGGYPGPSSHKSPEIKFPGSQPVSFHRSSLDDLERRNFWVCEKSDGVRVMVLIVWNMMEGRQEAFIIDRKNTYYQLPSTLLPFLHHDPRHQLVRRDHLGSIGTTLIDGELVFDAVPIRPPSSSRSSRPGKDEVAPPEPIDEGLFARSTTLEHRSEEEIWRGKERRLRLYAFDCLLYDGANLMGTPLQSRYGRLKSWLIGPFRAQLDRVPQEVRDAQPFEIVLKPMELADGISSVIEKHIPGLQHAYDGLIFTCAQTEYVLGKTDENIMKWKPPEENTIDFDLELRYDSTRADSDGTAVDLTSKPIFVLNAWAGGSQREFFDVMDVSDETWEEWKSSGEQFDDRVIECSWSAERGTFEFMRFRPDKTNGNHISVVHKVIDSIQDGVSLADLQARCPTIREKRKARAAGTATRPPPMPPQPQGYPMQPQGFAGFVPQTSFMHGGSQPLRR